MQMTNHEGESCLKCFVLVRDKVLKKLINNNPDIIRKDIHFRDYRIEWVCKHNIGHTIWAYDDGKDIQSSTTHGCDGCCRDIIIY